MKIPVVDGAFAARLEQSESDALCSRLSAVGDQTGNPFGVSITRFGNSTAFLAKGMPGGYFNSVRGFGPQDLGEIDNILTYYREHGMPCRIHVQPGAASSEVFECLADRGLYQSEFRTTLYGSVPGEALNIPTSITIRDLDMDEFITFGDIYVQAHGMPESYAPSVADNNRVLCGRKGWHFYLASMDGEPAAVGVLYIQNGIGSLAAAATKPSFRRRGCQSALLYWRMVKAAEAGCEIVVSQTNFGSVSQTTMERAGIRIAYTKAVWQVYGKVIKRDTSQHTERG